jgi:hypothetical protein
MWLSVIGARKMDSASHNSPFNPTKASEGFLAQSIFTDFTCLAPGEKKLPIHDDNPHINTNPSYSDNTTHQSVSTFFSRRTLLTSCPIEQQSTSRPQATAYKIFYSQL